jgi:hypothetical protein
VGERGVLEMNRVMSKQWQPLAVHLVLAIEVILGQPVLPWLQRLLMRFFVKTIIGQLSCLFISMYVFAYLNRAADFGILPKSPDDQGLL